jgi:nitronate monooxygenase
MALRSDFLARLGIPHPIIQAPLAGGGDTPALVAAVAEAGGLGFIGAAYLTPDAIRESAREVRRRTKRPFGINLFVPNAETGDGDSAAALAAVAPFYRELGLSPPTALAAEAIRFDDQLAAALDSGASVFSFTLGCLPEATIRRIKDSGMLVMGTASTVEEAGRLEEAGVDAVVLQGAEAGGHRCTFMASFDAGMVGTLALVPQVADAVRIPVVASGGIMDGRGIAAALALGADAVQMGTAFLTTAEAGVPAVYKEAIFASHAHDTRLTRAFSGRPARGIVNRFMREIDAVPDAILPFPHQNALTRPIRTAAAKAGRAEYLSLWAGQGVGLARREAAGDLVDRLASEAFWTITKMSRRHGTTTPDVMRQVRHDRNRAILATIRRLIAAVGRRLTLFGTSVADGIRIGRGCPTAGDVGLDGIRLAHWFAGRLR